MNVDVQVEGDRIKGTISNIGQIDFEDVKLNVIGSEGVQELAFEDVDKGGILSIPEQSVDVGYIRDVIVVPSVDYNGDIVVAGKIAVKKEFKDLRDMGVNFIPSYSWTIGEGSVGKFGQNGATSENSREFGIGPYGDRVILWKGGNDADSNADGGWNTNTFPIDHTKKYRVSVWIKKTNSNSGTTYFGIYTPVLRLSGSSQSNPYFFCGDLPSLDKWYLVVGYIFGSGENPTATEGGIWDGETGTKVRSWSYPGGQCNGDYKFSTSSVNQRHRSYLYYDTTVEDRQYFWDPRFEEVNGGEPSIEGLLRGF